MSSWAGFWIALVLFLAGTSAVSRIDCAMRIEAACAQIVTYYAPPLPSKENQE
jgi:hypothetical protein